MDVRKAKAKKHPVIRLTEEAVGLLRRLRQTHAFSTVFVNDKGADLCRALGPMMGRTAKAPCRNNMIDGVTQLARWLCRLADQPFTLFLRDS
jgi:hypothetical protein